MEEEEKGGEMLDKEERGRVEEEEKGGEMLEKKEGAGFWSESEEDEMDADRGRGRNFGGIGKGTDFGSEMTKWEIAWFLLAAFFRYPFFYLLCHDLPSLDHTQTGKILAFRSIVRFVIDEFLLFEFKLFCSFLDLASFGQLRETLECEAKVPLLWLDVLS